MDEKRRDDALFEELDRKKRRRKRKTAAVIAAAVGLAAIVLLAGTFLLRRRVEDRFGPEQDEVMSYQASAGSISTTVSGSGRLEDVDLENVSVPLGVEIDEVRVEANSQVEKGDVLATVDMASVMSAMADVQEELDDLDDQLKDAASDRVSGTVSAGVRGRVKKIYVEKGGSVADCMAENGALALISLDGTMAVDIENGGLTAGEAVTVRLSDGSEKEGSVEAASANGATVLVTDDGTLMGDSVTVLDGEGGTLGSGELYIHSPLRVTGITGTVSYVVTNENQRVSAGSTLFRLSDTGYSAGYETLLRQRREKEETLLALMKLHRDGALLSPITGSVSSVEYDKDAEPDPEAEETAVVTLSPDESMTVTISVDETEILSLAAGQEAEITVDSVGEDVFKGSVAEVDRTAAGSSGVTRYSAEITLEKDSRMLPGMTASVTVRISGVDNAVLIPADALHQTRSSAYVYTEYDAETGEFGGMVEVVPGISGGDYVEIISGLELGTTVYYTPAQENFFRFGGFEQGGDMPGDVTVEYVPVEGGLGGFGGDRDGGNFPGGRRR